MKFSSLPILLFIILEILFLAFITRIYFKVQHRKFPDRMPSVGNFITAMLITLSIFIVSYIGLKAFLIWATSQDDVIGLRHITLAFDPRCNAITNYRGSRVLLNYMMKLNEIELRSERVQKENSRAKLANLQSQLNPHFLFNNFNTLDGLISENPSEASRFVNELAKLYRSFLNDDSDKLYL